MYTSISIHSLPIQVQHVELGSGTTNQVGSQPCPDLRDIKTVVWPMGRQQRTSFVDIYLIHLLIYKNIHIPNSRACWVSISRAGAGLRGLAAFKIRNGTLEPWNLGILENLEPWNPGTLEPWNPGTLEPWNPGTPEPWNPETLEPWNPATVEP